MKAIDSDTNTLHDFREDKEIKFKVSKKTSLFANFVNIGSFYSSVFVKCAGP